MLILTLHQFFAAIFPISCLRSGQGQVFYHFSTVAFQAASEISVHNHTSAYHLWQAFFSHSGALAELARLLFYTFAISYFLLDPVKSNEDLHVLIQKVVQ